MPNRLRIDTEVEDTTLLTPETALELGNALLDAAVLCIGNTAVDVIKMKSGRYIAIHESDLDKIVSKVQKDHLTVIK